MKNWLSKLFNIRQGEWTGVLFLFAMIVLVNVGAVWGPTIAYAHFLTGGGLETLPVIFVLSAVLSLSANAIYSAFVDRVPDDRLMVSLLLIGMAAIGIGLGMLALGLGNLAYATLYLLFLAWIAVYGSHYVTYASSFYDTQAAKRVLPVLFAGSIVGVIIGGVSMQWMTGWLSNEGMIIAWLLTDVVCIGIAWFMRIAMKDRRPGFQTATASAEKQRPSYLGNLREGLKYTTQSVYLRWMALSALLLMMLLALLEYKAVQLFLSSFTDPAGLANYLALLGSLGNLIALPLLLFGVSRIINRMGVGNTSMVFPIGSLLACSTVFFTAGAAIPVATTITLDRTAFRFVFQSSVDSLLYNAVPAKIKGRARAFLGGLVMPVGTILGGLYLIIAWGQPELAITITIALLAVAYLLNAFIIRRQYSQALVKMLEEEDYSFLLTQEAGDLPAADPATLSRLQKKLEESSSHELRVFMTKLIAQIGGRQAISYIAPTLRSMPEARTRSAMLDVLTAAQLSGDKVKDLYHELLADPDGQVRQSALAGLEQLANDQDFYQRMLEMIHDPDMGVCARAMQALVHSGDFYRFSAAERALETWLAGDDPGRRARGVQVLGKIGQPRAARRLLDYLDDPMDPARLQAALAIEDLSVSLLPGLKGADQDLLPMAVQKMTRLLHDPIERIRQAALQVLGRAGTQEVYPALVEALADPSPQVRATAVDALVQAGKAIVPTIKPRLDSKDPQARKMAVVLLSRIDPKEFGALVVDANIKENLQIVYRNYGLAEALSPAGKYRSIRILQSALIEQSQRLAEEILYFLTAIQDKEAVKIIGDSLRSSNSKVRANAAEALESLTNPQVARLAAPIFDPGQQPGQLAAMSSEVLAAASPDATQAVRLLACGQDDAWLKAITLFALGEIGAELKAAEVNRVESQPAAPQAGESAAGEAPRRPRRGLPSRLLDALGEGGETAKPPEAPIPEPAPSAPQAASAAPLIPLALTLNEIQTMTEAGLNDLDPQVRQAAQAARRALAAKEPLNFRKEAALLSTIDRIIFLKEVPFFHNMTIDQLKVLANVCEEKMFEKDARIFQNGDAGGVLYVVVNGRVGIEQEKRAGSFARLADVDAYACFGETNFFDNSSRSTSAVAIQDTLTLELRREPLIALARQNPDLALELINVLSQRAREADDRIAELTKSRPRELHKLYDQFG